MRPSFFNITLFGLALSFTLSMIPTTGFASDSREATEEEINQCVQECVAWFETPGAELKACVSSCLSQRRKPVTPVWSTPATNICETYEPNCDSVP